MEIQKLHNEDWFNSLIEEVKAINIEGVDEARWVMINTYHSIGKRILEDYHNFQRKKIYGEKIVQVIADSINSNVDENGNKIKKIDTRSLYYAIKFARKFPCKTEELPSVLMTKHGKNVSWTKVIKHELTAPKEKEECEHEWEQITRCSICKKIINE